MFPLATCTPVRVQKPRLCIHWGAGPTKVLCSTRSSGLSKNKKITPVKLSTKFQIVYIVLTNTKPAS